MINIGGYFMKIKSKIFSLAISLSLFLGLAFTLNDNKVAEVKAEEVGETFTPTYDVTSYATFKSGKLYECVKAGTTNKMSPSYYAYITSVTITNSLDDATLTDLRSRAGDNIYEIGEVAFDASGSEVKTDGCYIPLYLTRATGDFYDCTIYAPVDKIYANQDSSYLFNSLKNCKSIDLVSFDTSNVTSMRGMFSGLEVLENLDISSFDGSNVEDIAYMFASLRNIKNVILPAQNFAPKAKNASYLFNYFNSNNTLVSWDFLENLDTSAVTDMSHMFEWAASEMMLDFTKYPKFSTANVTNMQGMFQYTQGLKQVNLSSFNTSKVTDMSKMFSQCGLEVIDLRNFDTSSVLTMNSMFSMAWNTKEVLFADNWGAACTDMGNMFYYMALVKEFDLTTFKTSNVTTMASMFNSCVNLTTIKYPEDLDTSNVTSMSYMYAQCWSLVNLDLGAMDISSGTNVNKMFNGCKSLSCIHTTNSTLASDVSIELPKQFTDYAGVSTLDAITSAEQTLDIRVEYFVGRWQALRAAGGENGICAALVSGTNEQDELAMLFTMYEESTAEQQNLISNHADIDGVTIGESMQYLTDVLNGNTKTDGDYGIEANPSELTTLSVNLNSETTLIMIISVLSIIAISGYYVISKRKSA